MRMYMMMVLTGKAMTIKDQGRYGIMPDSELKPYPENVKLFFKDLEGCSKYPMILSFKTSGDYPGLEHILDYPGPEQYLEGKDVVVVETFAGAGGSDSVGRVRLMNSLGGINVTMTAEELIVRLWRVIAPLAAFVSDKNRPTDVPAMFSTRYPDGFPPSSTARLLSANPDATTTTTSATPSTKSTPPSTNYIAIHPNGNLSVCLDVAGNMQANGTPVQVYECNGSAAQKWIINRANTKVQLSGTNFCLDAGSVPGNGVKMKICESGGGTGNEEDWG